MLVGHVVHSLNITQPNQCVEACILHAQCKSINLKYAMKVKRKAKNAGRVNVVEFCELNAKDTSDAGVKLVKGRSWNYMETSRDEISVSLPIIFILIITAL